MDRDKDAKLTYDEFVEGSKQDPTIVQVLTFLMSHPVYCADHSCDACSVGSIII